MESTDYEEAASPEPVIRVRLVDLLSPETLDLIYASPRDHYWSDEWTPEFFVAQARAGFISVSHDSGEDLFGQVLLPQIHTANAVLDWGDLHLSRSTRRWMRSEACKEAGYELHFGYALDPIMGGIAGCHGENNWLDGQYPELLRDVASQAWDGFELAGVGLTDKAGRLLAGEIGYRTGRVFTSMTGFLDRNASGFNHVGKLQLFLLAEFLRDEGYTFWNLGQPYMQYKFDLGAKVVPRVEFLARWAIDSGQAEREGGMGAWLSKQIASELSGKTT